MMGIFETQNKGAEETHLGTTGSSALLAASMASFHRAVQRHHLQPGSRPMLRRLLPLEAEKSRNSRLSWPGVSRVSQALEKQQRM